MCILERSPKSRTRRKSTRRSLGVFAAVLLLYFNVSGGPIGAEPMISSAGPLPGLLSLAVFPFVWSLQIGLMTAELSSAFPANGGYSVWVTEAMGDMWGWQESYYSWFSGVTDNALYPGLIWSMIQPLLNSTGTNGTSIFPANNENDSNSIFENDLSRAEGWLKVGCKVGLALIMTVPNLLLVGQIDKLLAVIGILTIVPFLIFTAACIPEMELSNLGESNITLEGFGAMLQNLFWNMNGFDSISTTAGEVLDPSFTISRALWITIPLVAILLLLPLAAAAGVNKPVPWPQWQDGQFTLIAQYVDPSGALPIAIGFAAAIGGWGLYVTEMLEDSFQIHGMAECGMLPAVLAHRFEHFRTPGLAIFVNLAFVVVLQCFNLEAVTTYTNVLSCASVLLELIAFIVLRWKKPTMRRKFRVAGPFWFICLLFLPPFIVAIGVMIIGCFSSWQLALSNSAALLFGFAIYGCMKTARLKYQRVRGETEDEESSPVIDGQTDAMKVHRPALPTTQLVADVRDSETTHKISYKTSDYHSKNAPVAQTTPGREDTSARSGDGNWIFGEDGIPIKPASGMRSLPELTFASSKPFSQSVQSPLLSQK